MIKVIPLGISGYLPIHGRHSSCFLVLTDRTSFLLDAGTGAARLAEPRIQRLIAGRKELNILLSHYHVDHVVGLYYSFTQWKTGPQILHCPVCPFMPLNPEEAIGRLFSPPLNSFELKDANMKISPMNKSSFTIAGHRITVWPQQHPGGSVGFRIDDEVAYMSDTVVMMENVGQVAGVKLLLHELWLNEKDSKEHEKEFKRHACYGPVAEFVRAARPKRMMPVHLYPHYTDRQLEALTRKLECETGVSCLLPEEGRVYRVT